MNCQLRLFPGDKADCLSCLFILFIKSTLFPDPKTLLFNKIQHLFASVNVCPALADFLFWSYFCFLNPQWLSSNEWKRSCACLIFGAIAIGIDNKIIVMGIKFTICSLCLFCRSEHCVGLSTQTIPYDQPNWIWQSWQKIWIKIYTNPEKSIGAHFTIQRKICPFPGPALCVSLLLW